MSIRTDSHKRASYAWAIALAIVAFFAVAAQQAAAATLLVETTGTDSGTCGPNPEPACATITQAVTNATDGDTIDIGVGTFVTPVNSGIVVTGKSLTIQGAGSGQTFVDGQSSSTYTAAGTFRFTGTDRTQTVRDLSIINPGRQVSASTFRYAFFLASTAPPATGVNLTIENVEFEGPGAGTTAMFLETASNAGNVTIQNSTSTNVEGYHLLIQRNIGAVTVEDSVFTNTATSTYNAIIDANFFLGAGWPTTGEHAYRGNTINAQRGISIQAGFFGLYPGRPFAAGVTIDGNTLNQYATTEAPATAANRSPIEVVNSATNVDGTDGGAPAEALLPSVAVTDNAITGNGVANGVTLTGRMDGPAVTGNNIRGNAIGVRMLRSSVAGATAINIPTNVNVTRNQIVGNSTAGVYAAPSESITGTAINNWWGCNEGPPDLGCDSLSQPGSAFDSNPRAVLTLDPASTTLTDTGSTVTTAAITSNSAGGAISGFLFDGTDIGFSGTSGSVTPAPAPTTNSAATPTFQSSAATGRSVTATYDNQSVTYNWTDYDITAPVITITSPIDGTLTNNPNATLSYTVVDNLDPDPDCSPADGSAITLSEGSNTIVVSCTDDLGNIGTASVTVTLDTMPPVVNILTPQDNSSVANTVTSTTLTYQVADFGDANPICNPPNGSVLPLGMGLNTITVTCVDAAGNVGTDTVKVTRLDPPAPDPIDTLPACARDIVITNVVIKGSRYSQISGLARSKYVGQTVRVNYRPSGSRTIGRAVVRTDGTWSVVVRRPTSPGVGSNQARYRATLAGQSTNWIKLSRRLVTNRIVFSDGKLNVSGRVIRPTAPGRRLVVTRSDLCGKYTTVGTIAVRRDGRFAASVATTPRADSPVPFIRLHVKVRRGGSGSNPNREFTTYSIVRPVPVLGN